MEIKILPQVAREIKDEPIELKQSVFGTLERVGQFTMRKKPKIFLSLGEFGSEISLNQLERALIHQKNRLIDHLKAIRLQHGLTQSELARKVGTMQPAIARMEAGQVGEVSFDFLIRVALALGISLEISSPKKAA